MIGPLVVCGCCGLYPADCRLAPATLADAIALHADEMPFETDIEVLEQVMADAVFRALADASTGHAEPMFLHRLIPCMPLRRRRGERRLAA